MSRISGIIAGKIPEFRDWEKGGFSGNPEIGISGIAIATCTHYGGSSIEPGYLEKTDALNIF